VKVLVLGAGAVGTVSALKFRQEAMVEQLIIADAVSARAVALADRLDDPRVCAITLDAGNLRDVARALRETGTTILLNAALPATKAARYLQIENKIRAALRYDMASAIPLVP